MNARKRKSRKPSGASSKPPDDRPALFIDRSLGRHKLPDSLREAGLTVEVHDDHLPQDATDVEWLQLVGIKGWIAISRDKNIRYRSHEKAALVAAKARMILIRSKSASPKDIAELLISHKEHVYQFNRDNPAPYIASITRDGELTKNPL